MLLLVTLIGAVLAFKYNQRYRILTATSQIQKLGGQVVYRRENPAAAVTTISFVSLYRKRPQIEFTTRQDGTKEIRHVLSNHEFRDFELQVNDLTSTGDPDPEPIRPSFFSNEPILVDAVKVRERDIDASFVNNLKNLDGLKVVLVCRDWEYFRVFGADPNLDFVTPDERDDKLRRLNKPFENAKSLILNNLPEVKVVDGCWD